MALLDDKGLTYFFGKLKGMFAPKNHTHDDRYYTESEIDEKLSGKANSSHTHSYAGSASAGGSANSAVKLDTSTAGSATHPVYFSNGVPVATTYTLGKSVPANAVFTDTNTWRGVQNNLTSDATDQSLSAAQGKALKAVVDGKAAANHTHSQYLTAHQDISGKVDKSEAGANNLLATLTTTWTAIPTDNTYFVRQDTGGGNTFGRVKFSTLWSYIKGKGDAIYQPKGSYAASSHTHDDRYYTESEIDAKLKTKADTHSHPYLPTAGGTVTGVTAFTNTTASTNKSTGAVKVSGGVGVAGRMSANEIMIGDGCTLRYDATNKCVNFTFS